MRQEESKGKNKVGVEKIGELKRNNEYKPYIKNKNKIYEEHDFKQEEEEDEEYENGNYENYKNNNIGNTNSNNNNNNLRNGDDFYKYEGNNFDFSDNAFQKKLINFKKF